MKDARKCRKIAHLVVSRKVNKQLCCRKEAARCFVSLNILLSHSRSFEMTLLSRACVSPCQYFIETMSVSCTISEIFSVKEWRYLETEGRGRSRSLEMVPFDRLYTTSYQLYLLPFSSFTIEGEQETIPKLSNGTICNDLA